MKPMKVSKSLSISRSKVVLGSRSTVWCREILFATIRRYEEEKLTFTNEELNEAFQIATASIKWGKQIAS